MSLLCSIKLPLLNTNSTFFTIEYDHEKNFRKAFIVEVPFILLFFFLLYIAYMLLMIIVGQFVPASTISIREALSNRMFYRKLKMIFQQKDERGNHLEEQIYFPTDSHEREIIQSTILQMAQSTQRIVVESYNKDDVIIWYGFSKVLASLSPSLTMNKETIDDTIEEDVRENSWSISIPESHSRITTFLLLVFGSPFLLYTKDSRSTLIQLWRRAIQGQVVYRKISLDSENIYVTKHQGNHRLSIQQIPLDTVLGVTWSSVPHEHRDVRRKDLRVITKNGEIYLHLHDSIAPYIKERMESTLLFASEHFELQCPFCKIRYNMKEHQHCVSCGQSPSVLKPA